MICSVCTLVLQLALRGEHGVQSQPAVAFLLEMSQGCLGTGSSPLPSSETTHGQQRAEPGEAGTAHLGSLSRQGQQHMVTESSTSVLARRTSLWGDRRGLGQRWSLSATCSPKGLMKLPSQNVFKASQTSPSRAGTLKTELPCSPLCTQLSLRKAGCTTGSSVPLS